MTLLAPRRTLRVWQSCGLVAWDDGQLHVLVETVGVTLSSFIWGPPALQCGWMMVLEHTHGA